MAVSAAWVAARARHAWPWCIYQSRSWRTELAPRVQRERGGSGVSQGRRRLVVLCHGGGNHFDSVAQITRVARSA
eukprot:1280519-Prymnesium_polylepis.1